MPTPTSSSAEWTWRPSLWMYVAVVGVAISVIYVPDVGRGFVKDDFTWVVESRCRTLADLSRLFVSPDGFYRPMVSLSFAANEYLSGKNPAAYGYTNLVAAVLAALGVGWVAHIWRLPPAACLFAAALWLLNFHGINMAILWISGRTCSTPPGSCRTKAMTVRPG